MTERQRRVEPGRLRDPETGEWNRKEIWHYLRGWVAVAVALAVVFGGLWFVGTRAWDAWQEFRTAEDYEGEGAEQVQIQIPTGATMRQIGDLLAEADVVSSADTFVRVANSRSEDAARVQAGTYSMLTRMPAAAAFERLLDPAFQVRDMIQFREGQRLTEQVALMAEATGIPAEEFTEVVTNRIAELGLPEWAPADNAEGFLFPDTYELPTDRTALSVARLATTHFSTVANELDFANQAAASPAENPYTALIMASVLEREANRQEDRYRVARVFYNRLAEGMPLQSDATIAYANNITGRVFTTDAERAIDSPYNTYLNTGLPPGPVTSPSRNALDAALHPAEGNWLYFVVVNLDTGETEFNDTYEAHQASVNKLQEWCQTQAPGRCQ